MSPEMEQYIEKYPKEIVKLFIELQEIVCSIEDLTIEEKMWAKLPSFYCGEKFIRIIPFKDHINIEAGGLNLYTEELSMYKFTPKGMMQIKAGHELPYEVLKKAFSETLV